MASFTAPYASAAVREYRRYSHEKGIHLLLLDAQHDIQREAFNIDTLVARKVDAILVNVVDLKGSRAALKKAAKNEERKKGGPRDEEERKIVPKVEPKAIENYAKNEAGKRDQ